MARESQPKTEVHAQAGCLLTSVLSLPLFAVVAVRKDRVSPTKNRSKTALQRDDALPPGIAITKLQAGEYAYQAPGMANPVRITTRPDYYDEHSDSLELWSPGSPAFPHQETAATPDELAGISIPTLLTPSGG